MAARDPDTGQFVEDDDHMEVQYANHEFQTIKQPAISASGTTGGSALGSEYEALGGNLQHDELAELVSIRGSLQAECVEFEVGDQTEPGSYGALAEISINAREGELATSDQAPFEFTADEPGHIGILQTGTGATPFADKSIDNNVGGGGGSPSAHLQFNFRDHFGTGPFMDKQDDLIVRTEVEADNSIVQTEAQAIWQLGFRVYEIESQRPTFGFGD